MVGFATMHGKGPLVAPALATLGLAVRVIDSIDTDVFGTFTGSVARAGSALDAARAKALAALDAAPTCDFGLGSEGSFAPLHPFAAVNAEVLVLRSRDGALELQAAASSLDTPWRQATVRSLDEARAFAEAVGFPAQALVVGGVRGVQAWGDVEAALRERGAVELGVDARAHLCPKRQVVISACAVELAKRAQSECPACAWPGFGVTESIAGLPCRDCGAPTRGVRARVSRCRCGLEQVVAVAHEADPASCDACNP